MSLSCPVLASIPNRYMFVEKITDAIQQDPNISLMMIDVVRFSDVSTGLGYKAGDQILGQIGKRLQRLTGNNAILGRISGDIFGVMLPSRYSESRFRELYTHIIEHFKAPITLDGHSFIADFNVGAVANMPSNSQANLLFTRTELALKQAKGNKFENFCCLRLLDNNENGRSLTLKADLTRAIKNDELELYFQPKVNLSNLEIVGAECLLRWHHPLDGIIFPGALLEAAESYNMMNDIGYWVLDRAFRSLMEMRQFGIDLSLSVNMSPTQLYDEDFAKKINEMVIRYGVKPEQIELELTEDIALNNSLIVHQQLNLIKRMGFTIAVDDFGKGYSNLAYIRDLHLDSLKIDKTFILQLEDNPVNEAIVKATLVIAEALGCEVIAEGIETLNHLHKLRELGVPQGQGFLFSRAVPFDDFIRLTQSELAVGGSHAYQSQIA
ncbi:bifunctional diguanylate cyclase/phosphodiesterase [Bowmanella sp. JS7-9]|uniref:Bifunctional diguanylate cyclase/phosphodiesterase n=1 Tax=Pseudobowmanella zhangzhouensis TaxID=1537679 RepID=A0ABW1XHK5_9ALTE|nr:bifunctional diguanylate cyclase/phosphodiesterase [Bowmanella sp. JS7-9]TBX27594.1 diguanylate phosphodiesterase [Bowmanella sp. JS7-9]